MERREFLKVSTLAGLSTSMLAAIESTRAASRKRGIALGFDNFSVRAMGWKAGRLIDYAASLEVDSILFSDLDVLESFEPGYLKDLRARAEAMGLKIQSGTGSVCPSSNTFSDRFGSAEEHLRLTIRVAKQLGSEVARCYLGNSQDRKGQGGIQFHIRNMVEVLKKTRPQALAAGVKIAVENHAGDMQARELARLIEMAGPDFVGATMDSGNATWTLEDPMANLETLGPYAVCTGVRDSMVWEVPEGAVVQWTAIGDGLVDFDAYFERYQQLCPSVPAQLEIISGFPRTLSYMDPEFWQGYEEVRAADFAEFVSLARQGRRIPSKQFPEGEERRAAEGAYQREQLERSVRYCKEKLGLGLK